MSWYLGKLAGFDLETTGVNVERDRIVTASILGIEPLKSADPEHERHRWLSVERYAGLSDVDGVEIPAGASAVHGITTEQARAKGRPAARVVREIAIVLAEHIQAGTPICAMNAPYDLTLLDRELGRHGLPPLAVQAGAEPLVIDPLVLDKEVARYRKGKRNLTALTQLYGVNLTGAHEAAADALAAVQVAVAIGRRYPAIGEMTLTDLHNNQQAWARQQAESRRSWLLAQGRPADDVRTDWPLVPRPQVTP
jgi:DNA polymerase III subunit epsilon